MILESAEVLFELLVAQKPFVKPPSLFWALSSSINNQLFYFLLAKIATQDTFSLQPSHAISFVTRERKQHRRHEHKDIRPDVCFASRAVVFEMYPA